MNVPLFYGVAVALAFTAACSAAHYEGRRRQRRALRAQITRELHPTAHYMGAWMLSARSGAAEGIIRSMRELAAHTEPPESIIAILKSADAKVMEHLRGPAADLEVHARAWLDKVARRVVPDSFPALINLGSRSIVIVAYASKAPPPSSARLVDVQEHLARCVGAAVVVCNPKKSVLLREQWQLPRYLGFAGLGAAIVLVIIALLDGPFVSTITPSAPNASAKELDSATSGGAEMNPGANPADAGADVTEQPDALAAVVPPSDSAAMKQPSKDDHPSDEKKKGAGGKTATNGAAGSKTSTPTHKPPRKPDEGAAENTNDAAPAPDEKKDKASGGPAPAADAPSGGALAAPSGPAAAAPPESPTPGYPNPATTNKNVTKEASGN